MNVNVFGESGMSTSPKPHKDLLPPMVLVLYMTARDLPPVADQSMHNLPYRLPPGVSQVRAPLMSMMMSTGRFGTG